MPPCGYRPKKSVSQVERLNSEAAPGLEGRVCVVVGNKDDNDIFLAILKNKRLPYFKKISARSRLKKV